MNPKFHTAAAIVALGLLAGCTGGAANTGLALSGDAAGVAQIALAPADLAQLRATCQAAAPALVSATAPGAPLPVAQTAIYPAEFCRQLLLGTVPATADRTTLSWLPTVLGYVQDAARIAGMVLPMVLPLL